MRDTEQHIDRILARLRAVIREKGFTQKDVQEALGWGQSYIGQLLSKQKSLRVEQVVLILNVVDADVGQFWGDIYGLGERPADGQAFDPDDVDAELVRLGKLYERLLDALIAKGLLKAGELAGAIKKADALAQV